jgi:hypothetical protein
MKPMIKWHPAFRWSVGALIWMFFIVPVCVIVSIYLLLTDTLESIGDRFSELGDVLGETFGGILFGEKNS